MNLVDILIIAFSLCALILSIIFVYISKNIKIYKQQKRIKIAENYRGYYGRSGQIRTAVILAGILLFVGIGFSWSPGLLDISTTINVSTPSQPVSLIIAHPIGHSNARPHIFQSSPYMNVDFQIIANETDFSAIVSIDLTNTSQGDFAIVYFDIHNIGILNARVVDMQFEFNGFRTVNYPPETQQEYLSNLLFSIRSNVFSMTDVRIVAGNRMFAYLMIERGGLHFDDDSLNSLNYQFLVHIYYEES